MDIQTFWNEVGSQKDFEDPLYLEKLEPYLNPHSKIVEYGCGYGRLLNEFYTKGYKNIRGFDFAPKMIERGNNTFSYLDLNAIAVSGMIPEEDESCDCVIMSTILCCTVDKFEQMKIVDEVRRILKSRGVLYLSDFIICDHPRYEEKYQQGYNEFSEWGIYTTGEGVTVRHHSTKWLMELLEAFNIQWFEQFDFKTMNDNYARTFHCVAERA